MQTITGSCISLSLFKTENLSFILQAHQEKGRKNCKMVVLSGKILKTW